MRPLTLAECTRLDCIEAFRRAAELGYIEPGAGGVAAVRMRPWYARAWRRVKYHLGRLFR